VTKVFFVKLVVQIFEFLPLRLVSMASFSKKVKRFPLLSIEKYFIIKNSIKLAGTKRLMTQILLVSEIS